MTVEVLRLAARMPIIPVQRRMSLAALATARSASRTPPPWSGIFTKAYALVARETPVLRRAYFRLPIPHIHEYPHSTATIAVERMIAGESVVGPLLIEDPASRSLAEIGGMIREAKSADIQTIESFRRAHQLAMLPWLPRQLALWTAYNLPSWRGGFFGTFGVSVVASDGGELLNLVSPLATVLTYGPFSPEWTIKVRIMFDHRIVDAAPIARALIRLEQVLNGPIAEELRGPP